MTDIVDLASKQYYRIEWQNVPETVAREDLTVFIADAIRYLYVVTGRALQFREDYFSAEGNYYREFSQDLQQDEKEYVVVTAQIAFMQKVQTEVDAITSYSTDALSVTHGDKPFANLQAMILDLQSKQRVIWYKMVRFHHL